MEHKSIIPIIDNGDNKAVDGRTLHEFLEVGKDFSSWIKDRIEKYQFVENEDYEVCSPNLGSKTGSGGYNQKGYIISLDMAKELAMVENNEKGRAARKYFIEVEKMARKIVEPAPVKILSKEHAATIEWTSNVKLIMDAVGSMVSDDMKRRFILEAGIMVEQHTKTEIVPPSMERAFVLGSDVVMSEAVAKVMAGGQTMIVRDIAKKLGVRVPSINKALTELGYQTVHYLKDKDGMHYKPTKLGEKCCVVSEHESWHLRGDKRYQKITGWYIEHIFDDLEVYFNKTITKV